MSLLIAALLACSTPAPVPSPPLAPLDEPAPLPIVAPEPPPPSGPSIGGEPILPKPVVLGAISTADVVAGITKQEAGIQACYASRRAVVPDLAGKVLVKFKIQRDGSVAEPSTASTSLRDPDTEACVNAEVAKATFPALKDGAVAIVRYPFVFP